MPSFELQGQIVKIFPTHVVSERFQKRDFVVRVEDGKYPQEIVMQFTQQDVNTLDNFKEGDEVKVFGYIRGRMWRKSEYDEPKWFNSLAASKVEHVNVGAAGPEDFVPPPEDDFNQDFGNSGDGEPLPF